MRHRTDLDDEAEHSDPADAFERMEKVMRGANSSDPKHQNFDIITATMLALRADTSMWDSLPEDLQNEVVMYACVGHFYTCLRRKGML